MYNTNFLDNLSDLLDTPPNRFSFELDQFPFDMNLDLNIQNTPVLQNNLFQEPAPRNQLTFFGQMIQPTHITYQTETFPIFYPAIRPTLPVISFPIMNAAEIVTHKTKARTPRRKNIETRKIQETAECSICLLDMKKNSKIPDIQCRHQFHKKCLLSWLQKQQNCPLCRKDLAQCI